jgi:signal transduction histidine kinase
MLDVSRIRTGKLLLEKDQHDLFEITRFVIERMAVQFQASGIDLPTIRHSEAVEGKWDRFRLEQVITNLLTNAIRYGQGKPIEIDIRKVNDRAILSVKDQGYGISKQDQHRIFDRFERAINASEVSGMGLGLFITKEIIKAHQGEISVESEPGKGAIFIVDLPLKT